MRLRQTFIVIAAFFNLFFGCVSLLHAEPSLEKSLTFYASFDKSIDADYAAGDKRLYGKYGRGKEQITVPGLPPTGVIQLAKGEGRYGDGLRFTRKSDSVVFFKGPRNFDYRTNHWSGSISFWLKLDPDKDLEPGYCDPLQIAAGDWNSGVFFAEFSKDETPRHFRCAMRPLSSIWNPKNLGWEAIPAKDRPMVQVSKPPFDHDRWTHVLFTFINANTGTTNGTGKVYLNGDLAGEFTGWELTLNWSPEQIVVNIGAAYVGVFDELALFNRALEPGEVKKIWKQKNGLHTLLGR
jgi:hypothetical protein